MNLQVVIKWLFCDSYLYYHYTCNFSPVLDDHHEEDMQTLVSADEMLTNNVSDTLLLIENGDIPSNRNNHSDSKKIFT
jgi:hypothetical protein